MRSLYAARQRQDGQVPEVLVAPERLDNMMPPPLCALRAQPSEVGVGQCVQKAGCCEVPFQLLPLGLRRHEQTTVRCSPSAQVEEPDPMRQVVLRQGKAEEPAQESGGLRILAKAPTGVRERRVHRHGSPRQRGDELP